MVSKSFALCKPGATSADALIRLRERGALIRQSDRLHMKVYLSSNRGSVICSANASSHALGRNGLKEAGVFLPPGAVEMGRLLQYVRPRPISDADLRKLARASDRLSAGRPHSRSSIEPASLREWLASEGRKKWKLGWWDEAGAIAKVVKAEAQARYGIAEPASSLNCRKNDHHAGDWVLEFRREGGRNASWTYIDFVRKVSPSDKRAYNRAYPYQAAQVHAASYYPAPPFVLDAVARKAIAGAVKEFGSARIENLRSVNVPKSFKKLLYKHLTLR
jgi:hypothetical protein